MEVEYVIADLKKLFDLLFCVDEYAILNFQLSHSAKCTVFEKELTTFLLNNTTSGRKLWKDGWILNDSVTLQRNKLLHALRSGRLVTCPEDVKQYFPQQYIRAAFNDNAKMIIWDREPWKGSSSTLTKASTFSPSNPSQRGYELPDVFPSVHIFFFCVSVKT